MLPLQQYGVTTCVICLLIVFLGDVAARGTGNAEGKVHRQFLQDMLAKCDKCW